MSDQPKPNTTPRYTDPNNEPLKPVDMASFHPWRGATFDVTLCALIPSVVDDQTVRQPQVTARIRIDLPMAKALVEGLTKQVAIAEAAQATRN